MCIVVNCGNGFQFYAPRKWDSKNATTVFCIFMSEKMSTLWRQFTWDVITFNLNVYSPMCTFYVLYPWSWRSSEFQRHRVWFSLISDGYLLDICILNDIPSNSIHYGIPFDAESNLRFGSDSCVFIPSPTWVEWSAPDPITVALVCICNVLYHQVEPTYKLFILR